MEEFKKYYKFPLKMWEDFSAKVFTQENCMAFDWLFPWGEQYDNVKQKHLDKINGLESNVPRKDVTYIHKDGIIIAKFENGEEYKIAMIRGWGMLTGVGGYHLPEDKAAEIQDAFADYCVEMLNKK